jgi:hypothetical protein
MRRQSPADERARMARLRMGDHACVFYRTQSELLALSAAYLGIGLERNERCFCVFDEGQTARLRERLRAAQVDIDAMEAEGRCVFGTDATYIAEGSFDPERMVTVLGIEIQRALDAGFTGLRAVGEMSWTLKDGVDRTLVVAYEAIMNQLYPRSPAVGLCLYSLEAAPADLIAGVLDTHPHAFHNGHYCVNQFYRQAESAAGADAASRVTWMLGRLQPV